MTGRSAALGRIVDPDGRLRLARFEGDQVQPLIGDLFGEVRPAGDPVALDRCRLLPPVMPSKVVGIARNYRAHAEELGHEVPEALTIFLKPSTAVIGPGEPIPRPSGIGRVDHEAELGVVIGRAACRVPRDRALDYVLGYTCVNDVTARELQRIDGNFGRAKSFDGFCPLGPWIATDLDPSDLAVRCRVDGEVRQDGRTSLMCFDVAELVAFVSGIMTLLPGDVIATGTPAGVGPIEAGQVVEVEVEGVGTLVNPVVDRSDRLGEGG